MSVNYIEQETLFCVSTWRKVWMKNKSNRTHCCFGCCCCYYAKCKHDNVFLYKQLMGPLKNVETDSIGIFDRSNYTMKSKYTLHYTNRNFVTKFSSTKATEINVQTNSNQKHVATVNISIQSSSCQIFGILR